MINSISGIEFSKMVINASALINNKKQAINDLNVFPVPDGDTGTNMSLTIGAGAAELLKNAPESIGAASSVTANALLRGARGNSGVILSLLFRGIGKYFKEMDTATTKDFAEALQKGVRAAYKAVMKPTEGTILTVARLSGDEAVRLSETVEDFDEFLVGVISVGEEALANTIHQNPVLEKAGVIDAGGKGFIVILQGMLEAIRGNTIESETGSEAETKEKASFSDFDNEEINFSYCTEFIVNKENSNPTEPLREYLMSIGDSIVMVDDDEIIKVHVHTNEPGNVLTRALTYGSFVSVKIENMLNQHTEMIEKENASAPQKPAAPEKKYGTVAVCAGDGMMAVFKDLGVDNLVTGGQTMNPSTEDILAAVDRTPAEIVFVFPNNKNIIMAAEQCARLTEKKVIVIPTKTVPQGISALISFDPDQEEDILTGMFKDAAKAVHTALVTYAARDSVFDDKNISAGEYLALLEGALLCNSTELDEVIDKVSEALGQFDPELVTIFYGSDIDEDNANSFGAALESRMGNVDLSVVYGGQPVYYYTISAE
ncbi:MAG: DAK2 domain-containing protein [Oscillospiraceae bacterium]|nr:DAK2 domain-containing protein [Oscillospiraceae bacterium]